MKRSLLFFLSQALLALALLAATPAHAAWPITFGSINEDHVRAMAIDSAGNVYLSLSWKGSVNVLGASLNSGAYRGIALAKVNQVTGALAWVRTVTSTTHDLEAPALGYFHEEGDVFWGGSFGGSITFYNKLVANTLTSLGGYDGFMARYNASGQCIWARKVGGATGNERINGLTFNKASPSVIAVGSATGQFYFNGYNGITTIPQGGLDAFAVEYGHATGDSRRILFYGGPGDDEFKDAVVYGNVLWICGSVGNNFGVNSQFYSTYAAGRDGIVMAAQLETGTTTSDAWLWSAVPYVDLIKSPATDETNTIDVGNQGYVAVATKVSGTFVWNNLALISKGGTDILVSGYQGNPFQPVWGKLVGSTGNDVPYDLFHDDSRFILGGMVSGSVTPRSGYTIPGLGGQDGLLLRLDPLTGAATVGQMLGGPGNDAVYAVSHNRTSLRTFAGGAFSGTVTLPGGTLTASNGLQDGFAVSLTMPPGARQEPLASEDQTIQLKPYPSPAQHTVRMGLPWAAASKLLVLDAKGQSVSTPLQEDNGEAVLDVFHLPPGLYSIRLGNRRGRFTKE